MEQWPVVWGVYVGNGCVSAENPLEWTEIWAHSHNRTDDEWFGWICIADAKQAFTRQGNPSLLMKHEVAHLLVPDALHNKKWREVLTGMGGYSEVKKYEQKLKKNEKDSKIVTSKKGQDNGQASTLHPEFTRSDRTFIRQVSYNPQQVFNTTQV